MKYMAMEIYKQYNCLTCSYNYLKMPCCIKNKVKETCGFYEKILPEFVEKMKKDYANMF